jgi:hypothetical protein
MCRIFRAVVLTAVLAVEVVTVGCAGTGVAVGYRVYDPYHSDYHNWDANEGGFYNRWAVETHHDAHQDFRKLKRGDQDDYWKWRHDHR